MGEEGLSEHCYLDNMSISDTVEQACPEITLPDYKGKIEKPFFIYDEKGNYTQEILKIYNK